MTVSQMPAKSPRKRSSAAAAREAEAEDGYVVIEQCGVKLRIPVGGKVPVRASLRFAGLNDDLTPLAKNESGNVMGAALLLGDEQWKALLEKNPTGDDFAEITQKINGLSGN